MSGQDVTPAAQRGDDFTPTKRHVDPNEEESTMGHEKPEYPAPPIDPYGDEVGAAVQYKTMKWWQGAMVMIAENISLGILSLPAVLGKVGLVGGLIAIIMLGFLTTYSGYVLWQFRMKYPHVTNMGDVGEVLFGAFGREFFGIFYVIYCIFCAASHLLTFTIAMNVLTDHGTCTIVWGLVGLVVFSILTIPRTLKNVSFLSIISFLSILSAVLITIIALAISPKASYDAMKATYSPSFPSAFNSISNAVFAYGGHVAWLSFIGEFRKPEEFPKALITLQTIDTIFYVIAALVIYRYAGADVASPALNANSKLIAKIAWGIALPTIIIAGVIFAHVTAKYVYLRVFAGTKHLHSRGLVATGSWIGLGVACWAISWVIAASIPNFSDLLGFISALCASWFSYGIPGFLWFYLNRGRWFQDWKKTCLSFVNLVLVILAFIIFGVGLYASGYQMSINSVGKSWSCADNSH